ncbi:ABC transporter substrate-binding protein [Nocardia panacis]|uniref:Putative aliphatic sulfonates-binding protein n=1 Tax=Nocardia panacis TaxID=2340916 RepID=A0A3A4KQT9_9NOCA|nr:ABC transporter substrate-binding protein [Nocardia panacis]RJO78381.1 ABC transporter substrate-binding protein [Nocardia panacis]
MIRKFALATAFALLAALGAACGSNTGPDPAVRADGTVDLAQVTLRVGDQKGAGLQALLASSGELAQTPYKLSWSQFAFGPPILEAINAGAVDVGGVGNAPPVFAAAARSAIRIVGAYRLSLAGQAIVVPRDSPLRAPEQLRGKRIAVAKGSSAHQHLLAVLTRSGLKWSDIEAHYLQPADALAALSTGRVDAWAIWDPYTAQAEQRADARILVDGKGYVHGDSFYVAGAKTLTNKASAAALRDFLARVQRAHAWANDHPEQWARTYADLTGLPYEVTLAAARRDPVRDHSLDPDTVAAEQEVADSFTAAGLIPGRVDMTAVTDTRFNDIFPGLS